MPGAQWFPNADPELRRALHGWDHPQLLADARGRSRSPPRSWRTRSAALGPGWCASASARATGWPRTCRTSPRRSSPSSPPPASGAVWSSCAPEFGTRSRRRPLPADRAQGAAHRSTATATASATIDRPRRGGRDPGRAADARRDGGAAVPRRRPRVDGRVVGRPHRRRRARSSSSRCPSTTRCTSSTRRARPGLPKAIVHGHGGILLEHLKALALHGDLGPADRFFWFTTTGWMMWNYLVSGLLVGAAVVLLRRRPRPPRPRRRCGRWRPTPASRRSAPARRSSWPAARPGCGRGTTSTSRRSAASARPARRCPPEGFEWVYDAVGADVHARLDQRRHRRVHGVRRHVAAAARALAARSRAAISAPRSRRSTTPGKPVVGEQGELVITEPMPSMPVGFWGDADGARYRAAYFERLPRRVAPRRLDHHRRRRQLRDHRPLRRHAQPRRRPPRHQRVLFGGRGPPRGRRQPGRPPRGRRGRRRASCCCSWRCRTGSTLDDDLRGAHRRRAAARRCRPGTSPTRSIAVPRVPRTLSGKKLEVPVKRILLGTPADQAASRGALADPASLAAFEAFARRRSARYGLVPSVLCE